MDKDTTAINYEWFNEILSLLFVKLEDMDENVLLWWPLTIYIVVQL